MKLSNGDKKKATDPDVNTPKTIISQSYQGELSDQLVFLRKEIHRSNSELRLMKAELKAIRNSYAYRVGRVVTTPLRVVRLALKFFLGHLVYRRRIQKTHLKISREYGFASKDKASLSVDVVLRNIDHPTSSAFIRLLSPLTSGPLAGEVSVRLINGDKPMLRKDADVIIVQRTALPKLSEAQMLVRYAKKHDIKLLVDTDDAFTELDGTHPEYTQQSQRVEALEYMIKNSSEVWLSTPKLQELYGIPHSKVIQNTLDPRFWTRIDTQIMPTINKDSSLRMLYMGTATHGDDLTIVLPVLDKLYQTYPDAFKLHIVGVTDRAYDYPWIIKEEPESGLYPDFVRWFNTLGYFDFGLSPLQDTMFNRYKSDIKCLDYLASGIRPVVSDVEAYRSSELDDLVDRVKNSPEAWYEFFEYAIQNLQRLRADSKPRAIKGFEYVASKRTAEQAALNIQESLRL